MFSERSPLSECDGCLQASVSEKKGQHCSAQRGIDKNCIFHDCMSRALSQKDILTRSQLTWTGHLLFSDVVLMSGLELLSCRRMECGLEHWQAGGHTFISHSSLLEFIFIFEKQMWDFGHLQGFLFCAYLDLWCTISVNSHMMEIWHVSWSGIWVMNLPKRICM